MAPQHIPGESTADTTAQQRFLDLLKQSILKLDAAELDFGIYRILNYRRTQVLAYLDETLPGRIAAWRAELAQASGQALAHTMRCWRSGRPRLVAVCAGPGWLI